LQCWPLVRGQDRIRQAQSWQESAKADSLGRLIISS
jgi:hypothetical protein